MTHLRVTYRRAFRRRGVLVAPSPPPCCCFDECAAAAAADDSPAKSAASAAAAAARAHRQAVVWCCLCVCMCMCALCGWTSECALLPGVAAAGSADFTAAGDSPPPLEWATVQPFDNYQHYQQQQITVTSPPSLPLVAEELLKGATAEGEREAADRARAALPVVASAGTPVPPASPNVVEELNDIPQHFRRLLHSRPRRAGRIPVPRHGQPGALSDADMAAFLAHYHITSKVQLHDTLNAIEAKASPHITPGNALQKHSDGPDEHEESCTEEADPLSDEEAKTLHDGKVALIPVVFIATLGTSVLPWFIGRLDHAVKWLSFGACLSAGVILGAGFSHMLPDAEASWATYFCVSGNTSVNSEYPWAPMIAIGVLLLLVTVDSLLAHGHGLGDAAGHGHSHGGQHGHSHAIPQLPADYDPTGGKTKKEAASAASAAAAAQKHAHASHPHHHHHPSAACSASHVHAAMPTTIAGTPPPRVEESSSPSPLMSADAMCPEGARHHVTVHMEVDEEALPAADITPSATSDGSTKLRPERGLEKHTYGSVELAVDAASAESGEVSSSVASSTDEGKPNEIESLRGSKRAIGQAYVFFLALSLHSIFDGLSIGAEQSMSGFYALLFAVGSHKLLDGFALGVPVFFANWPMRHTLFALVFCAAMTPLGIGIGMVATEALDGAQALLAKAIIISMSAGSFIFISLVELLPAGLMDGKHLLPKMAVTAFGWAIMVVIAIWV